MHAIQSQFLLDVVTEPKPRPFLKWVGGKGGLLTQFESLFPRQFNRYFEPFIGGGAVFFELQPSNAVLNDINPNLVWAYRNIKNNLEEVLQKLLVIANNYAELDLASQEAFYYQLRERYNQLEPSSIEKTCLLIFLNRTGYNGLYRENASGQLNVPFGTYKNPTIYNKSNLRAVSASLQNVELLNLDFRQAVKTAQKGDFIYFDPPYIPLSKTASFTSYSSSNFGEAEQIALAELVKALTKQGVLVMLSNSDTPFTRTLYKFFRHHEVKAGRAINSKSEARGKITELVITNYDKFGTIQTEV